MPVSVRGVEGLLLLLVVMVMVVAVMMLVAMCGWRTRVLVRG